MKYPRWAIPAQGFKPEPSNPVERDRQLAEIKSAAVRVGIAVVLALAGFILVVACMVAGSTAGMLIGSLEGIIALAWAWREVLVHVRPYT